MAEKEWNPIIGQKPRRGALFYFIFFFFSAPLFRLVRFFFPRVARVTAIPAANITPSFISISSKRGDIIENRER